MRDEGVELCIQMGLLAHIDFVNGLYCTFMSPCCQERDDFSMLQYLE